MPAHVVPPPVAPLEPAIPDVPVYRLGVEQYHTMIRQGILAEGDPVELLEGWLVTKMTKYPPHTIAKGLASDALAALIPDGWFLSVEDPLTTPDSEPEPDIMVVRGRRRDYHARHPGPVDVALVVEVSDASLARDRATKKRLYARAGLAAYWIVNLVDRRVEVYTDPSGPAESPDYRTRRDFGPGDEVPLDLGGHMVGRVAVAAILP